jgi:hypothetical protein
LDGTLLHVLRLAQDSTKFIISWSKSQLFFIFHNFMVKINTFLAEWWSGSTSADRQGQNTDPLKTFFFQIHKHGQLNSTLVYHAYETP